MLISQHPSVRDAIGRVTKRANYPLKVSTLRPTQKGVDQLELRLQRVYARADLCMVASRSGRVFTHTRNSFSSYERVP